MEPQHDPGDTGRRAYGVHAHVLMFFEVFQGPGSPPGHLGICRCWSRRYESDQAIHGHLGASCS